MQPHRSVARTPAPAPHAMLRIRPFLTGPPECLLSTAKYLRNFKAVQGQNTPPGRIILSPARGTFVAPPRCEYGAVGMPLSPREPRLGRGFCFLDGLCAERLQTKSYSLSCRSAE